MRTKTLLIAAAALAAGVLSTQAQPVYSQNVVGYVNTVIPGNNVLTLINNPLTDGLTNNAETVLSAMQGGENVYLWNGSGYYIYNYNPGLQAQGYMSDWIDAGGAPIPGSVYNAGAGATFVPTPTIPPGVAFFLQEGGSTITNTFVGSVILASTNTIPGNNVLSFIASGLPISGDIETNTTLNLPLQGGENILIWNGSGFYIYNYNPGLQAQGYMSDWIDGGGAPIPGSVYNAGAGATFVPNPQVSVGQGFFYQNGNGPEKWVQNLVLQ